MNRLLIVLLFCFFMMPFPARAEEPFVSLDGTRIEIGMRMEEVFEKLGPSHQTKKIYEEGSTSSFLIQSKEECKILGNIQFYKGKVNRVLKPWTNSYRDSNPQPFIKALHRLLEKFREEGETVAKIDTYETKDPSGNVIGIRMNFNNKSIEIHFVEDAIDLRTNEKRDIFPNLNEVLQ